MRYGTVSSWIDGSGRDGRDNDTVMVMKMAAMIILYKESSISWKTTVVELLTKY